jgi:hypothetical protein
MANFFSRLPNIIVGDPHSDSVPSNYITTKNLFRRSKVIPEVLRNFTYFTKYTIPGNAKPYQVSHDIYGSRNYEWVILITNDITNVYEQWPLSAVELEKKIKQEYGVRQNETKYWRTKQIKDDKNNIIVPGGLIVEESFTYRLPNGEFIPKSQLIERVTNYEYELEYNDKKRNIYLVYPDVLDKFVTEYNQNIQYAKHQDLIPSEPNLKGPGNESYNRLNLDMFQ